MELHQWTACGLVAGSGGLGQGLGRNLLLTLLQSAPDTMDTGWTWFWVQVHPLSSLSSFQHCKTEWCWYPL